MEYIVVDARGPVGLSKEVNKLIKEGWVPQGGVSNTSKDSGSPEYFYQAMIRNDQCQQPHR
jgi:hypothetical protein